MAPPVAVRAGEVEGAGGEVASHLGRGVDNNGDAVLCSKRVAAIF